MMTGCPRFLTYKRKDNKPEHQQVIRAAARPRTVSEQRGMSMGLEQQLEMREEHKKKVRSREQGKRLGIFVVLGLVLFLIGIGNGSSYNEAVWVTVTKAVGGALLVFGYPLARLWFGSERRSRP